MTPQQYRPPYYDHAMHEILIQKVSLYPVSYTHLDVYKRQVVENYLNITSTSRHLGKRDEHIKFYFWASNNATSLDYINRCV